MIIILVNILSIVFLVAAVWVGVDNCQFLKDSIAVPGKIVDVDRSVTRTSANSSSRNSYPIIEYRNPLTQQKRKFKASVAALNVKIGKPVWIAYSENQQREKLISFGEFLIPAAFFALFGITLLVIVVPLSESSQVLYWLLKTLHVFKQ